MKKIIFTILLVFAYFNILFSIPNQFSNFIRIDQFGYREQSSKVAVIINPIEGYDADQSYFPSTQSNAYQVRKWSDDAVVFSGTIIPWNNGALDPISGDKAWWFDFSSVTIPGNYYIYDSGNQDASYKFRIDNNVYQNVLKAAMRMFYYNRCNFEKQAIHAGTNWADAPSFIDQHQDTEARSFYDQNNNATAKDLSGGWWDAGDYNKYISFTNLPMHHLLDAYEVNPSIWTDNYNIPESGNGIPDIIDELKWELNWMKKMQLADGSFLPKIGTLTGDWDADSLPPSTDKRFRYYYPDGCSSATIVAASVFARAALVFKNFPSLIPYANDLKVRAVKAYNHFNTNPITENCDPQENGYYITAGDADANQESQMYIKTEAAVYLYALTGQKKYRVAVNTTYGAIMTKWWDVPWNAPYETNIQSALLYYSNLSNSTATVANDIIAQKTLSISEPYKKIYGFEQSKNSDPYRSYMDVLDYSWGSNLPKANLSILNYELVQYNLLPENHSEYLKRAEEILHYYHGVNPFNMVYLSNMGAYGAEKSVTELYHSWFKNGSAWDNINSPKGGPAPGYLVGGPNQYYTDAFGNCEIVPPCNQPVLKAYANINDNNYLDTYKLTEPAIYYQAGYIKMLSHFIGSNQNFLQKNNTDLNLFHEEETFTLFPNPTENEFFINYTGESNILCNVTITDGFGKVIYSLETNIFSGKNFISHKNLSAGVYFVNIKNNNISISKKLVVL
jgi:endoglucanase